MTRTAEAKRRGRLWAILSVAILGLFASAAVLTALLAPGIQAAVQAEPADGASRFSVGIPAVGSTGDAASATVVPGAGWEVRRPGTGALLLYTPDRVMTVHIEAVGLGDENVGAELDDAIAQDRQRREILSSGLELQYVDHSDGVVARVGEGDAALLLTAGVDPEGDAHFDDYRNELSTLLESIEFP